MRVVPSKEKVDSSLLCAVDNKKNRGRYRKRHLQPMVEAATFYNRGTKRGRKVLNSSLMVGRPTWDEVVLG